MKHTKLWIVLVTLVAASLACNMGLQVPTPPASPIAVSTEAVGAMQTEVSRAAEEARTSGVMELTLTEEQLTSALALEMQKQQSSTEFVLSAPQVYLQDGKIQAFAQVQRNNISLALAVIIEPQVNDGQARLKLVTATLGLVAAPDSLREQLQAEIDKAFASYLASNGGNFIVETLTITDGAMTLRGRVR